MERSFDFTNVKEMGDYINAPGIYEVTITKVESDIKNNTEIDTVTFTTKDGKTKMEMFQYTPEWLWKYKKLFAAVEVEGIEGKMSLNVNDLIGCELKIEVIAKTYEKMEENKETGLLQTVQKTAYNIKSFIKA